MRAFDLRNCAIGTDANSPAYAMLCAPRPKTRSWSPGISHDKRFEKTSDEVNTVAFGSLPAAPVDSFDATPASTTAAVASATKTARCIHTLLPMFPNLLSAEIKEPAINDGDGE